MSFYSFPIHFKAKGTVPFNIVPKCEMVFKSQENAHSILCWIYVRINYKVKPIFVQIKKWRFEHFVLFLRCSKK